MKSVVICGSRKFKKERFLNVKGGDKNEIT